MSAGEIEIFEKVWKMLWELIYKIAAKFGWNISDPWGTTNEAE